MDVVNFEYWPDYDEDGWDETIAIADAEMQAYYETPKGRAEREAFEKLAEEIPF